MDDHACASTSWLKVRCVTVVESQGAFFTQKPVSYHRDIVTNYAPQRVLARPTILLPPAPPTTPSDAMAPHLAPDELDMITVCAAKKMSAQDICEAISKRRAAEKMAHPKCGRSAERWQA